jgi:O-antigen/teichoic acid export membrane protein
LISVVIIARLLTPGEIGLFAVSFAIMLVLNGFRGLGVGAYIIQVLELDFTIIRSAFTVAMSMGAMLAALINISAGYIANLYGEPMMESLLRVLSLNFIIFPFTIMVQSKAVRVHDFGWLALAELAAAFISSAVSIHFAWKGYGAISLAYGAVTFSFISTFVCGVRHFKLVEYGFAFQKVRELMAFGGWVTGSSVLFQLNLATVDLIVGKFQGLVVAGLYDRAATVNRLVGEQIYPALGQVLFSSFAQEKRDGHDLVKAYFYRLNCVLDLLWPLLIWLAVFGDYAVEILFGGQWQDAGPVARLLAISIIFTIPFSIAKELGVALEKVKGFFYLDLGVFLCRVIAVVIAVDHGIHMVALALIFPAIIYMCVSQWLIGQIIKFSYRELLLIVWTAARTALTLLGVLLLVRYILDHVGVGLLYSFIMAGLGGGLAIVAALFFSQSPLRKLVIQQIKRLSVR